jgi:hypothetical protein
MSTMDSVFEKYRDDVYPFKYKVTLHVPRIVGGIPSNEKVAEGWLRSKLSDKDDIIREAVAKTMAERGVSVEEATEIVNTMKNLNGFKRDENGLYIEGRQVKAAIKEMCNVRWPKHKWGPSNKGTRSYIAEHIFVPDERIYLGKDAADGIIQRFVVTFRGTGIQYEEYCENVELSFTLITDHEFTQEQWAEMWLCGEQQGIGASRSQGNGRYTVIGFERI